MEENKWIRFGDSIINESNNNISNQIISLSNDGKILAVGEPSFDSNKGRTRIFRYDDNWIQIGNDILGENINDFSGKSVSLNYDGSILAVGEIGYDSNKGRTIIYRLINNNWIQIGDDISGLEINSYNGNSVNLNSKGNIVIIGEYGYNNNSGLTRVYKFNGCKWNQIGNNIEGLTIDSRSGFSVSINSKGNIIAIGEPGFNNESGRTRIFKFNCCWKEIGLISVEENSSNGFSVDLSSDGKTIVIGEPDYNNNQGRTRIFKYINNNTWIQKGSDINGSGSFSSNGSSVKLNYNGCIVAIGEPLYSYSDNNLPYIFAGKTTIYKYINNDWNKIGNDILGENSCNSSGYSISLSKNKLVVAVYDPGFENKGKTTVYKFNDIQNKKNDNYIIFILIFVLLNILFKKN